MIICIVFAVILTGIQIYVMATDKTKKIGKMAEEFIGGRYVSNGKRFWTKKF